MSPTNSTIRPTSDKVRQAIFNILLHKCHLVFEGFNVLDICAGTGALGFEALSHGAESCDFFDHDDYALKLIQDNATKLKMTQKAAMHKIKVEHLPKAVKTYDLVFIDPPYRKGFVGLILPQLSELNYLKPSSLVVVEEARGEHIPLPPHFKLLDQRAYGSTQIICLTQQI